MNIIHVSFIDERVVSFNKFASLCLELGLFREEKQKRFAKVLDKNVKVSTEILTNFCQDKIQNVQDLEDNLSERLNEIRLMFLKSSTYDSQLKGIVTKLYKLS